MSGGVNNSFTFQVPCLASIYFDAVPDATWTHCYGLYFAVFGEFETLLQKQANLEEFLEWLRTVVQRCILQGDYQSTSFKMKEKQFLLMWARVGSLVIREMTLISARSFGKQ